MTEIKRLVDTSTGRFIHLSKHARMRMAQMKCDPANVLRTALEPHATYLGNDTSGRTKVHQRDDSDVAVVYAEEARLVITVLEHTTDDYERQDK